MIESLIPQGNYFQLNYLTNSGHRGYAARTRRRLPRIWKSAAGSPILLLLFVSISISARFFAKLVLEAVHKCLPACFNYIL